VNSENQDRRRSVRIGKGFSKEGEQETVFPWPRVIGADKARVGGKVSKCQSQRTSAKGVTTGRRFKQEWGIEVGLPFVMVKKKWWQDSRGRGFGRNICARWIRSFLNAVEGKKNTKGINGGPSNLTGRQVGSIIDANGGKSIRVKNV